MPRTRTKVDSLAALFDASRRPVYAINNQRRIVYCNAALAEWLELRADQIVGRVVEYHSESSDSTTDTAAPLTELCPPPQALRGEPTDATVSTLARRGGLVHRRAQFLPLPAQHRRDGNHDTHYAGVLVLVSEENLPARDLSSQLSGSESSDDLHRIIRQFRRTQAKRYSLESLLGTSSAMNKVRAQVAAAAAGGANVLIRGPRRSGRSHIARAIHFMAVGDAAARLVPVDCQITNDDLLRRAVDTAAQPAADSRQRATLLLENINHLPEPLQVQLVATARQLASAIRIIATLERDAGPGRVSPTDVADGERRDVAMLPELLDALSTITIEVPPLAKRLEDLPVLTQYFLEAANRGNDKQVGSVVPDALDLMALHRWPGELEELRNVIEAAHAKCGTHEITPADLPAVIHHASKSAAVVHRTAERIQLDQLLAEIEREAIVRALHQAGGNKTEAADLLGMTRPRLYRRLLQLGLAGPEFIEQEPDDDAQ